MKNAMKRIISLWILIIVPAVISIAQPPFDSPPSPDYGPGGPVCSPVGDGLWTLFAFVCIYSAFKLLQIKRSLEKEGQDS
jgi:hypothetical protein